MAFSVPEFNRGTLLLSVSLLIKELQRNINTMLVRTGNILFAIRRFLL